MTATATHPDPLYAAYESLRTRRDNAFALYRTLPLTLAPFGLAAYQTLAEATADACRVWLATRNERKVLQ